MTPFLIKTLQLLLSLSILVFIHELGHFFFARLFKMRVDKFYLFFDPWFSLFKFKSKGSHTEYGIGWLPLGGYCKINGMVDESLATEGLETDPQPWEFRAKPAWQRLLVMIGGVLFNVILAIVIYSAIVYTWGTQKIPMRNLGDNIAYSSVGHRMGLKDGDLPVSVDGVQIRYFDDKVLPLIAEGKTLEVQRDGRSVDIAVPSDLMRAVIASDSAFLLLRLPAVIDQVLDHSEAAKAGLQAGDRIVGIDGQAISELSTAISSIGAQRGDSITLQVLRSGEPLSIRSFVTSDKGLGVAFSSAEKIFGFESIKYDALQSIPEGAKLTVSRLQSYTSSLKYVATKEGASKLGGLGTIGSLFPASFNWYQFWQMTAFLSVILAVMNILPIPALDGGHILFILIEVITRRKLSIKTQERIQIAGLIFLLLLMVYANVNDIFRFLL